MKSSGRNKNFSKYRTTFASRDGASRRLRNRSQNENSSKSSRRLESFSTASLPARITLNYVCSRDMELCENFQVYQTEANKEVQERVLHSFYFLFHRVKNKMLSIGSTREPGREKQFNFLNSGEGNICST